MTGENFKIFKILEEFLLTPLGSDKTGTGPNGGRGRTI